MDKITINSINLFYDDFQALKNINSTGSAFMFSLEVLPIIFVVYFAINYGKYIVENSKKK